MKPDTTATTLNHWRDIRNWAMAAALLFSLAVAGTVQGQTSVTNVIYNDSFARVGQLVGTMPDTVDVPGATWYGGVPTNGMVTDGSEAAVTNKLAGNPWANAWLPLTVETGHVYVASCSIFGNKVDGSSAWLGMGFAVAPGQVNNLTSGNVGSGWLEAPCSDTSCALMRNGNNTVSTISYGAALNSFMNFTLVLNAASNPGNWSETLYTNGVQVATYTYGNVPTAENGTRVGFIGLSESANARGDFKNFSVTDIVPVATAPVILEQPNNLTAQAGHAATFWVNAIGLPDPTYQWVTNNGVGGATNAIVGATGATYTTPLLTSAYNNLQYQVIASTAVGSVTSLVATLTVNPGQPTVFSATKSAANLTNIIVMFSGPVDTGTGLNPANYVLQINGTPVGVSILGASPGSVPGSVVLQTSTLDANAGYNLAVQNVQDKVGEVMNTSTNPVLPSGLVIYLRGDSGVELDSNGKVAQWLDQTTNGNNAGQYFGMSVNVASLYIPSTTARPTTGTIGVNNTPALTFTASSTTYMTVPYSPRFALNGNQTLYCFASPSSYSIPRDVYNENVGNLPAGFDFQLTGGSAGTISCQLGDGSANVNAASGGPALPVGAHLWAITSQDVATNPLAANPSPVTNLTSFYIDGSPYGISHNLYPLSAPGSVYATKPLYIGYRQDHFASAVMDGQMGEIMIYNTPLSGADRTNVDNYFGQKYYSFSVNANLPATVTSSNGFAFTYTIGASQGPLHFSYQWQENGTNIPAANGSTYTTPILGPASSNTTYDVVLTFPNGSTFTSATNTLDVLPAAPFVASVGVPLWEATSPTNIIVLFDEAVNPATATVVGNYTLSSGNVLSAAMGLEPNKVILTTTAPLPAWNANPGSYDSLTVQNVQDVYGQTINTASTPVALYPATTALWLEGNAGVVLDTGNSSYQGVQQWNDQSGNQDNLFQQNGAIFEPALTNNAYGRGLPTVQFSGTNVTTEVINSKTVGISTFLTSANVGNDYPPLRITGDMSVFAVASFNTLLGGTNGEILGKTGVPSANQPAPYDYYVSVTNAVIYRGNGTNNGNFQATSGPSLGTPHVVSFSEAGDTVSHYVDGAPAGTGVLSGWDESLDLDQGQALQLGERADFINRLNGSISELILIGQALDSNELASVHSYLIAKYDIPTGTNSYPVITQQPMASTNIDQDSTLVVPAAAAGNPLYLQWYDTNNVAVPGQTTATLTINNIQTSDSYYLVATNIFGASTSSVVTVTVYSGLTVALGPSVTTLYTGQPYTFTAQALGTTPIHYQWYQGASPILNATNASYSTVATLGSINYSCTVTNSYNGYTSTNAGPATLTGIAAPANAFSQTVLADGPVAYWRLNESPGSPIAYDYVGGYNALYGTNTTNGLPGVPFAGASGELGVAMDNTAPAPYTNGFISTPGLKLNTNTVTLVCWVLPYTNEFNPSGLIFCRTGPNVFGDQIGGNETLAYTWNNNPATYTFGASGVTVTTNIWSMTALAISPSSAILYVFNSALSASAANNVANPPQDFSGGLAIGADQQGFTLPNRIFNGEMDETAVFNYTLSFAQLQQLYNAAVTGVTLNTNPTNIVFAVTNNTLYLSWPADHTGWQLQAQTNKNSVGLSTNWANYDPSTGTNQVAIPVNLTNGTVFYRLLYTP